MTRSRTEWAQQLAFGMRDGAELSSEDCKELFDLLTSTPTEVGTLALYREGYEAFEAIRVMPWYEDGRNNAEREAAEDRLGKAIDAIRAIPSVPSPLVKKP